MMRAAILQAEPFFIKAIAQLAVIVWGMRGRQLTNQQWVLLVQIVDRPRAIFCRGADYFVAQTLEMLGYVTYVQRGYSGNGGYFEATKKGTQTVHF